MSSIMDMLRPGPGGPPPPPPGLTPGPLPGAPSPLDAGIGGPPGMGSPPGMGDGGPSPDIPPDLMQLMQILGVDPNSPSAEQQPDDVQMSPVEHVQAAMMHLMMAFTQEEDHGKGAGLVKGMGALQGILAGAQKDAAAKQPPPAIGG